MLAHFHWFTEINSGQLLGALLILVVAAAFLIVFSSRRSRGRAQAD